MPTNPTVPADHAPFTATISYLDALGNPATPDHVPVWSSSNESVATVVARAGGMTADITLTGSIGVTNITATETETGASSPIVVTGVLTVASTDPVSGVMDFAV